MNPFINIAVNAARQAGNFIMRSYARPDLIKVSTKQPGDFVTDVDKKSEKMIIDTLLSAYPAHSILSEECGQMQNTNKEFIWIIDPIDGTTNFIHGFPHFCISIALQVRGQIEAGVIYDPLKEDLFTAARGEGALKNDRRIRVSQHKGLQDALLSFGAPGHKTDAQINQHFEFIKALTKKGVEVRRTGSSALNLAYVASGQLDACWKFGLKPWDLAAGILLIKEAGGIVTEPDGAENYLKSGNVVAGNPRLFKELVKEVRVAYQ